MSAFLLILAPVVLAWSPKSGDKAVYDVKASGDFGGTNAVLHGKLTRTVESVEAERVVLDEDLQLKIQAEGRDLEGDAPFTPVRSVLKPDGTLLGLTTAFSPIKILRLGRLTELVLPKNPIEIGGTWTAETTPDPKADSMGVKLTYTFVGEEKAAGRAAYKIAAKGVETGKAKATGETTFWIDETTGQRLRTRYVLTGLDEGPGEENAPSKYEQDAVIQPS